MGQIKSTRLIQAPLEVVFGTVASVDEFEKAIPHVVRIEILEETPNGIGTRFRETRKMNGVEAATEIEIREYLANDRIRLVSDTYGTLWDTTFSVSEESGATRLDLVMNVEPHSIMAKLANPLMTGAVARALETDMDAVKKYCEQKT